MHEIYPETMSSVQSSAFSVQCSVFSVQCSVFGVQCLVIEHRCSLTPDTRNLKPKILSHNQFEFRGQPHLRFFRGKGQRRAEPADYGHQREQEQGE